MSISSFEFIADNIPAELKEREQWVFWRGIDQGSRINKIPCDKLGCSVSVKNPENWVSWMEVEKNVHSFSGAGFAFGSADEGEYVGVDLDKCRNPETGLLTAWAQEIVDQLDTYTEVSPSQTGVKMWLRGRKPKNTRSRTGDGIECYDCDRYFTVTGQHLPGTPSSISDVTHGFEKFVADHLSKKDSSTDKLEALPPALSVGPQSIISEGSQNPEETLADCESALGYISPDCCYDDWINVGFAIKSLESALGRPLFEVWNNWSSKGLKYDGAVECFKKWQTFPANSLVTEGTIFYLAMQNGFRPSANSNFAKTYSPTDAGIAEMLIEESKGRVAYDKDLDKFGWFDGAKINFDGKKGAEWTLLNEIRKLHPKFQVLYPKNKFADRLLSSSQQRSALQQVPLFLLQHGDGYYSTSDFDTTSELLHLTDGVTIDLRTGDATQTNLTHRNTRVADASYDGKASCPRWESFISEIACGDNELCRFLQVFGGYLLSGMTNLQKLFILCGGGCNGKGTFVDILSQILGDYATKCPERNVIKGLKESADNEAMALQGVRLAHLDEIASGAKLDENKVKELTSGERLTGRKLYCDFTVFQPYFKLVVSTNNLPEIEGTDKGIWRRLCCIPFNADFSATQDVNLKAKLLEEKSGILNWLIEGAKSYFRDARLPECAAVSDATGRYKVDSDIVAQWLTDCANVESEAFENSSTIYESFQTYCSREFSGCSLSQKALTQALTRKGFKRTRKYVGNIQQRGIQGLRVRTNETGLGEFSLAV